MVVEENACPPTLQFWKIGMVKKVLDPEYYYFLQGSSLANQQCARFLPQKQPTVMRLLQMPEERMRA